MEVLRRSAAVDQHRRAVIGPRSLLLAGEGLVMGWEDMVEVDFEVWIGKEVRSWVRKAGRRVVVMGLTKG